MKKGNLVLASALSATMLFAGCSSKDKGPEGAAASASPAGASPAASAADKPDISKEVKLKMYLIGDAPKDLNLVYEEINKKLKKDINATVEPVFLSWGDYAQKYPLLFASGEDFDLIFSGNWIKYNEQANKGAFLELTPDMLNKYAPLTMKDTPKEAWEQAKVMNKIYMVPTSSKSFNHTVVAVRGDLRQKYNIPELKTMADFEKYLDAVAKNEPNLVPFDESNSGYGMFDIIAQTPNGLKVMVSNSYLTVDLRESTGKVSKFTESPQYLEFAKKMAEYAKKGYWSKNALVNKTPIKDSFLAGKSASMSGNLLDTSNTVVTANQKNPEWKVEMFDLYNGAATYVNPYIGNGMSINAKSKNPERALMLLDLFRNNEEYFNLTTYGIKGKHFELTGDNKVQVLNSADNGYKPDTGSPWGWRTQNLYKTLADAPKSYDAINKAWEKTAITNPLLNFVFDNTNVKNELASIKNVKDQYANALNMGAMDDPVEGVKTLNAKYKEAGIDKVMAELQKQIDEYLKTAAK